jgi:hypothetical protein
MIAGEGYGFPVDVFAFAVVLFQIIFKRHPFLNEMRTKSDWQFGGWLVDGGYQGLAETGTAKTFVRDLIKSCWARKPSDRPDFPGIFQTLKANDYQVVDGVDTAEVASYVADVDR